jgi:gliding motility-associated lipoprotein GldK
MILAILGRDFNKKILLHLLLSFKVITMNKLVVSTLSVVAILFLSGCKLGKSKSKGLKNDGQLYGVAPASKYILPKPPGMVYIPSGTFHMGPSDEDVNYAFTARNKQVSISGFWMDATEITNNEYRQFTNWVRDSIAAKLLGSPYVKQGGDGNEYIDWKQVPKIKWNDKATIEKIDAIIVTPDNRIFGQKEIDPAKIVYHSEVFDFMEAAKRENANVPRGKFIVKSNTPVYPDTLAWVRDFSYSYNEPMAKQYFSHPAYGNYPAVGITWKQATAFCDWRTHYLNSFLISKKRSTESPFRLPTEAQWEYAARGGRSQSPYPWGGPYLRNRKGCLLANFKPGRGNYPEDGGFYTVRADAYWPNDFGLYNMAGNVAEWTSSLYYEGGYDFQHDMNPDIRWNAQDQDPPRMKRKVIRGGSWKDVGYFLQTSTRAYEYQDTAKAYIGFRCVIDLPPTLNKKRK